jgi:cell division protease FtsH
MSEELGPITFGRRQEQVFLGRDIAQERNYSEEVAYSIDKEVRRMIENAYNKTEEMIKMHLPALHIIADKLIEKETLEGEELETLMKQYDVTQQPNVTVALQPEQGPQIRIGERPDESVNRE